MAVEQVPCHPILDCARALERELQAVADLPADYLRASDKAEGLTTIARVEAELAELKLRILATASDVADEHAARDAGTWLAHATRITPSAARADLKFAEALEQHPATATALRAGAVNTAQAQVIVRCIDKLPADLDPEIRHQAERHLVDLARVHNPGELRILAARILDVVAPDIAETELGKALEREEQAAADKCSLKVHHHAGDGTTRITALVPDAIASRLTTYLDAHTNPRVTTSRSRGQAFCALLENLDPARLPDHGGDATAVMVTIDLHSIISELGSATLDNGTLISASEARRLACNARIIPVVLGGKSEPLDLGRARRLHTPAQRKAMRIRDKGCKAEGCSVPVAWTEAHHLKPWSHGGSTSVEDGVLFCGHHHRRAHDTRYDMTRLPSGGYRFHRRT